MKCKLLGTGAAEGIPALFCECEVCTAAALDDGRNIRGRSCAIFNDKVMVDFPPDMLTYKVRYGMNLAAVSHLFFTHSHIDHLAAGELCYYHKMYSNRKNPDSVLQLYGNEKVLDVIRSAFIFDMGHLPDCVSLNLIRAFHSMEAAGLQVTALPAAHDTREECLFYLFEQSGRRILLANDTAMFTDEVFNHLAGSRLDAVILDCTGGKQSQLSDGSHMCFADNIKIKELLMTQGSADENTYFVSNHISHNGQINYDDFVLFSAGTGFVSSYDGMEILV